MNAGARHGRWQQGAAGSALLWWQVEGARSPAAFDLERSMGSWRSHALGVACCAQVPRLGLGSSLLLHFAAQATTIAPSGTQRPWLAQDLERERLHLVGSRHSPYPLHRSRPLHRTSGATTRYTPRPMSCAWRHRSASVPWVDSVVGLVLLGASMGQARRVQRCLRALSVWGGPFTCGGVLHDWAWRVDQFGRLFRARRWPSFP